MVLVLLNNKNREQFSSIDDTRFEKMLKPAEQFKDNEYFGEHTQRPRHVSYVQYQQCLKCDFNRTCFIFISFFLATSFQYTFRVTDKRGYYHIPLQVDATIYLCRK